MQPLDSHDISLCIDKLLKNNYGAPKSKHVRRLIIDCFHHNTGYEVWRHLCSSSRLVYELGCFKALILVNKLLVGGPKILVIEASYEKEFFDWSQKIHGRRHLITKYVQFTWEKISFHKKYPSFSIDFAFNEKIKADLLGSNFQQVKEVIVALLNLAVMISHVGEAIFARALIKYCHLAAVIPLIEQSYGIYTYIKELICALLERGNDKWRLKDEIKRFKAVHVELKKFYNSCLRYKYVSEVVDIPKLPKEEPFFETRYAGIRKIFLPQRKPEVNVMAPSSLNRTIDGVREKVDESEITGSISRREIPNTITHNSPALPLLDQCCNSQLSQVYHQSEASRIALNQAYAQLKDAYSELAAIHQHLRKDHLDLLRQYRNLKRKNAAKIIEETSEARRSEYDNQEETAEIISQTQRGQTAVDVLNDLEAVSKRWGDEEIESRIGSLKISGPDHIKLLGEQISKGPKLS